MPSSGGAHKIFHPSADLSHIHEGPSTLLTTLLMELESYGFAGRGLAARRWEGFSRFAKSRCAGSWEGCYADDGEMRVTLQYGLHVQCSGITYPLFAGIDTIVK